MSKYTPQSPIAPETVLLVANQNNFPVSFMLAVGHNESHLGSKGRAVQTRNPMNVGNTDGGDYKAVKCGVYNNCLERFDTGLTIFVDLIKRCYFHENEEIKLSTFMKRDFRAVRCNVKGKRYMTDTKALIKYQERVRNLQAFGFSNL